MPRMSINRWLMRLITSSVSSSIIPKGERLKMLLVSETASSYACFRLASVGIPPITAPRVWTSLPCLKRSTFTRYSLMPPSVLRTYAVYWEQALFRRCSPSALCGRKSVMPFPRIFSLDVFNIRLNVLLTYSTLPLALRTYNPMGMKFRKL